MIRPATQADLAAVRAIDAENHAQPRPLSLFTAILEAKYAHLAVCLAHETLVGFVEYRTLFETAELIDIAVAEQARRQGHGQRLLAWLSTQTRNLGAEEILLEVRASNTPARQLYGALGYSIVGQRPRYYRDGEDAVLYRLELR